MVELTSAAIQHLVSVRSQRGHGADAGARFVKRGNGLGLTFSEKPQPGDTVVKADGIQLFVAPDVATKLETGVIDVGDKSGNPALFLGPRARRRSPAGGGVRQPARLPNS